MALGILVLMGLLALAQPASSGTLTLTIDDAMLAELQAAQGSAAAAQAWAAQRLTIQIREYVAQHLRQRLEDIGAEYLRNPARREAIEQAAGRR